MIYYKLDQENDEETEEMKDLETLLGDKRTSMKILGELTIEVFFGRQTIY